MPDDLNQPKPAEVPPVPDPEPVPPEPPPGVLPTQPSPPIPPSPPSPPSPPPPEEPLLVVSTPPTKKSRVKVIMASIVLLILLISIPVAVYLVQQKQEVKPTKAGSIGQWGCISPKGIKIISQAEPGSPGDLGYKPAKSDPADASGFYDVSKGEVVNFQVSVQDTKGDGQPINDFYTFGAAKVVEAPIGTPITEKTNLDEVQLYNIHYNQGTKQVGAYTSGKQAFTIPDGGTATVKGSWTPTECGYYQLDIGIYDFEGTPKPQCPSDVVAAAGFIRVMNCPIITPTPTPTPTQVLSCTDLTGTPNPSGLSPGDEITFACTAISDPEPINHFEFRVSIDGGTPTSLANAPATKTDSEYKGEIEYTVPDYGCYKVECRACTSSDSSDCTQWGQASKVKFIGPPVPVP